MKLSKARTAENVGTEPKTMSAVESKEHERLSRLWATGRASTRQILRCMELDRKPKVGVPANYAILVLKAKQYDAIMAKGKP